jgi:heat shock protein HtpX
MVDFGLLIGQLMQPVFLMSFVYTLLACSIACIVSQVFLLNNPKAKSLIYLTPLFAPLAAFLLYPNPLTILSIQISNDASTRPGIVTFATQPPTSALTISVFGALSLIGLAISVGYLIVMYTVGDKVVSRLCGVIQLTPEEDPQLYALVNRLSRRMQIVPPIIGIVENLKPNAFTFGRGKKRTLVCSVGLLELLDEREMEAALAHELAHVKNRDFNLKALTSVLKIASFYNPLVYLVSSAVSRQREMLADETASNCLANPDYLRRTLIKIAGASIDLPGDGVRWQIASSLFIVSPAKIMSSVLSSHPPIVNRISHLVEHENFETRNIQAVLLLFGSAIFLVLLGVGVYEMLTSITMVTLPDGSFGLVARANGPMTIFQFAMMPPLGSYPWNLQVFSVIMHRMGAQAASGMQGQIGVLLYQNVGTRAAEWYTSDGDYSLLLSFANIVLGVMILAGAIWPTKTNQQPE